jgi:electron transfer flavoprotein alpha subunit
MRDVAVMVEVIESKIQDIAYELFEKARELAENTKGLTIAIVMGNGVDVSSLPCDAVYYVEDEKLENFSSVHARVLSKVIQEINPKVILAGNTSIGTDLAVKIAAELNIPIASLCTEVSIENGDIKATSLAYGGKLLVDLVLKERGIVLVNRGSFPA